MIDISETEERLRAHLRAFTVTIGERSVARLEDLGKAAEYIESFYREIGLPVRREPYPGERGLSESLLSTRKRVPL